MVQGLIDKKAGLEENSMPDRKPMQRLKLVLYTGESGSASDNSA